MRYPLLFLFCFTTFCALSQKRFASADISTSLHGSGDLVGPAINFEYGKYIKKRLAWSANFTATIHSGAETLLWINGAPVEGYDFREVTAGLQVGGYMWVSPIQSQRHEVRFGIGPLVRYQSASHNGGLETIVLRRPDPVPAVILQNNESQHLFSPGYQAALVYSFVFKKGLLFGLRGSLQNDTNADIITQVGLRVGKRF